MSDTPNGEPVEDDPGGDTAMFQAFAQGDPSDNGARGPRVGVPFRVLTLLAGLVAFGLIVVLLLR